MRYFSGVGETPVLHAVLEVLTWLLACAAIVGSLVFAEWVGHIGTWLIWLCLFSVPFCLARLAIESLPDTLSERAKRRHKLYSRWEEYTSARDEWHRVHSSEIAKQRERQRELRRQEADEARRRLDWWKSLDGKQFEKEVAGLLRRLGYQAKVTPYSGDGGVDISVQAGATRIVVQCKAHSNYISPGVVRELYGTMIDGKADEGWVVTTNGFYSGAHAFARDKPIKLITIAELLGWESQEQEMDRVAP